MKSIPKTKDPLVLRTDFAHAAAWNAICATIREPVDGFLAYVEFLDDAQYDGLTKEQLLALLPEGYQHHFIVVVDQTAASLPDFPLLVVDLYANRGCEFRAIPAAVQSIENNLSIANMDFEEFAWSVDESGVFRGFPGD